MKKIDIKKELILRILAGIQIIVSIALWGQLWLMDMLPPAYLLLYGTLFLVLFWGSLALAELKKGVIATSIVSILVSIVTLYGAIAVGQVHDTVKEVTSNPEEVKTEMVVVVLKDSEAEKITDLSQFLISYMEDEEDKATPVMEEITASAGGNVSFHAFSNVTDMADALYAKTVNALIMNRAYIDILTDIEGYEDFADKTKIIYSYDVVNYIELVDKSESNLNQFVVYISGIDTWGQVSVNSRSDVNILAIVNTETKQVQLINTPRDYYVELPNSNGGKDKLTHAGIYGVDSSMGALEMLYDVEIDYFVRMNFSGFEAIIDALGGVDVYSEYDFTVTPVKHYVKGINHLTGIEALAFARERHAFADGDNQRGKNQMAVITAMADKLMSPELLYNYTKILDSLEGTFQTNMEPDEIYELVKIVLADPNGWKIESYAVTGTGGSESTFSTPNSKSYVMYPNETDVQNAKEKIKTIMGTE